MQGYSAGQIIGGASGQFAGQPAGYYTNTGYGTYSGVTKPADVLANINIQGGASVPGVVETTTGGNNVHFATTGLLGDSNLLQHAIQNAVFGTTPSLALDITRFAGVLSSRNDTEESQYFDAVSPTDANGSPLPGIYDAMLPILQSLKQKYNFVGSYFINVGDGANPDQNTGTDWTYSGPIYQQLIAMGNEIGSHSYTHLINPPTVDANGNPVPINPTTGVSTWSENTNTLYVTPPANGSAPNWTFSYEFGQGNTLINQNIGIKVAGAAVPGAPETFATSEQIEKYYQSVPGGLTGYVNGGWSGVGAGYPNAFGYLSPTDTGSVYMAPNMTFDFTEIEFQKKTPTQALADWESLFNQLSADSETPVIVWPWHDYGITNWDQNGSGGANARPGYTEAMFENFIAYAYAKNYEFVTNEGLAARIAAQQKAVISETTSGNVITATVTPDPSAPDVGEMALNVINSAAGQVIQNAGTWYAYDSNSIFLPRNGGTFSVTLGTTQDDVTHIDALPMRADLLSLTGNGANLNFSIAGDGVVDIHVKTPGTNIVSVQGAPAATLVGDDLSLTFNDGALAISATSPQGVPVQHNVTVTDAVSAVLSTGTNFLFGTAGAANNLTLTGLYENYTLTPNGTTGETIADQRIGTPNGTDIVSNIQNFTFSDGLKLTLAQLQGTGVSFDTGAGVTSTAVGQVLLGLGNGNNITAGANNQVLDGGSGSYTLSDGGYSGVTLIGGPNNDTFIVTNAGTKVIDQLHVGDTVRTNLPSYTLPTNVTKLVLNNTAAAQSAYGNGLADTFQASSYHHDSFYFEPSFGKDVITNFAANTAANHDNLDLAASLFAPGTTVNSLVAGTAHNAAGGLVTVTQSGNNTVIGVDANDTITLNNVTLAALKAAAAADIHFV
jgi:hypothetical protein